MANVEIKVPSLGESENEATLVSWLKAEGDAVAVDDVLAEIESDKITMEITALDAGVMGRQLKQAGDTVEPGEAIGSIDTSKAETRSVKGKGPNKEAVVNKAEATKAAEDDVQKVLEQPEQFRPVTKKQSAGTKQAAAPMPQPMAQGRIEERVSMSGLRKRIAVRLKDAQNTAAMLTTFNEVNMQPVMDMRAKYKDKFQAKHDVGLGFMSFFVKACAYAAEKFPAVNAFIDGDEIVYHNYMDVGIAVSTDKGLVVPVLRDAASLNYAAIEQGVLALATRARDGELLPDDLKGGTFSITNGGVFGSLLSTPILNPPQSAILGMHAIKKRPVVEDDQIVIRPMMYLALTYDHRLIDGKEAVQFLVAVKEYLEQPAVTLLDL